MPRTLLVNFVPVFDDRHLVLQLSQGHWHFSGKRSECNDELESQKATKMCRGPVDRSNKELLNAAFTPAAFPPGFFWNTDRDSNLLGSVDGLSFEAEILCFFPPRVLSFSSFRRLEFLSFCSKKKPDLHTLYVFVRWRRHRLAKNDEPTFVNKAFTSLDRQSENMTCLDWEYTGQLARKAVGLLTFCQLQTRQIIAGKRQCDCCKKFAILFHIRHSTSRPWRVTYPKIGEILRRCCTPAADEPRSPL